MVNDGVIGRATIEKRGDVEDSESLRPEREKSPENSPLSGSLKSAWSARKSSTTSDHKAGGEPYLPGLAEIEIFPALVAEPFPQPAEHLPDTEPFAK